MISPSVIHTTVSLSDRAYTVHTGPGATVFTRMPRLASNWQSPALKFWIAPLVTA